MTDRAVRILAILAEAKKLAREYRDLTGKPLGVTGEVAEYEAARILGLSLADVRQPGYDASSQRGQQRVRYQIKGRCITTGRIRGQKLGKIQLDKEWDALLMVLVDADLNALSIYEADRQSITAALQAPGSKSRNVGGALSVSKVKSLGRLVWSSIDPAAKRGG